MYNYLQFHVKLCTIIYICMLGFITFNTYPTWHALWFVKWYTVNNLVNLFIYFVNEIQTQDAFSKLLLEKKKDMSFKMGLY
jgi:hypothetical protein